ncbi:hypothetical protein FB45DRAFT_873443 [Roridomyces roridus]|uniref:Uncharacterized protein n=1 Tax=Roridomyces roridus TaxID=1738132 RepID=A0AAD7BA28_9AGAR|nr:hypothetical protein FB45DRAFT_873443 [Roridomyces roridus]
MELFDALWEFPPVLPALEFLEIKRCQTRIRLPPLVCMLSNRRHIEGAEPLTVVDLASFKLSFRHGDEDHFQDDEDDLKYQTGEMAKQLRFLHEMRDEGLKIQIGSDFVWFEEFIDAKIIEEFKPASESG